jgi:excisionase family DNA binding protein
MALWRSEGLSVSEIATLLGMSKQTVYRWLDRFERMGTDGLLDRKPTGRPRVVPNNVRSMIVALARASPPAETGLSHWSTRGMAAYLRYKGIEVSHNFIAEIWREHDLKPNRQPPLAP